MKDLTTAYEKFIYYCRNLRRFSYSTVRAYRFDLNNFISFTKDKNPPITYCSEVNKQVLEEYLDHMVNLYSVKTIRRRMTCIRSFFNYLEEEEIVEETPFKKFKVKIKEPFKIPNTMSLEEVSKILATAYGNSPAFMPCTDQFLNNFPMKATPKIRITSEEFIWVRDISILELLFAGGLRVSELCGLEVEDLNVSRQALRVRGKGNKERIVYLENVEVIKALNRYMLFRKAAGIKISHIFITKFGKPLSTQAVRNLVEKYTKEAGINKKITPHVFRHTFASLLLEEGVDIKYIQDFLGHSSITTTQIYLHTTSNQKRKIIATQHPRQKLFFSEMTQLTDSVNRVNSNDLNKG